MRLSAKDGLRGTFVNTTTGERVRFVRWYDPDTQVYERFAEDPVAAAAQGRQAEIVRGRAPLRFIPAAGVVGRLRPSRPGDVEPLAEARRRLGATRIPPMPWRECEEPRCHALAVWQTGDEQEIEPVACLVLPGQVSLEERAVQVRRHLYCARHWRPPLFRSVRGVDREHEIELARPQ